MLIPNRFPIARKLLRLLFMNSMPADILYLGYRIVWDTRQLAGTGFWTGKVAVVLPADGSGVKHVWKVSEGIYAGSEEAARECLINMAKDWINTSMGKEKVLGR